MRPEMRGKPSLLCGLVAFGVPALAWGLVVVRSLQDPRAFHDQGGMFITLILFPASMLAALGFGVPALLLSAGTPAGSRDATGRVGAVLGVVGFLLAAGVCVGPQVLADLFR